MAKGSTLDFKQHWAQGEPRMCHVVMNASAGSAHRDRLALALRAGLPRWPITLHAPVSAEELLGVVRNIPMADDLVVAGGDGTLQCALPALMESKRPVVVLPLGTANDFATHWGYSADVLSLQRALSRRVLREVDVLQCNDIYFVTVGGIGVGAFLTRDFNKLRRASPVIKKMAESFGSNIYTALAAATIVGRKAYLRHLQIETPQGVRTGLFSNIFMCNQARLGGDLLVAPDARTSDGFMDVLFLRGESKFELIHSLACLRMNKEPFLSERITVSELTIKTLDNGNQLLFADGESFEMGSELRVKVHKAAISLLTTGEPVA